MGRVWQMPLGRPRAAITANSGAEVAALPQCSTQCSVGHCSSSQYKYPDSSCQHQVPQKGSALRKLTRTRLKHQQRVLPQTCGHVGCQVMQGPVSLLGTGLR
jgi:hypothetical protein